MSRYNPARSSFISRASSKMEDNSSSYADNTNNEDDFAEDNEDQDISLYFTRRNSNRFNRQPSRRSNPMTVNNEISDLNDRQNPEENGQKPLEGPSIHIAPLPPFNSTSTPTLQHRNISQDNINQRNQLITSVIDEETVAMPAIQKTRVNQKQISAPSESISPRKNEELNSQSTITESPSKSNTSSGFNSSQSIKQETKQPTPTQKPPPNPATQSVRVQQAQQPEPKQPSPVKTIAKEVPVIKKSQAPVVPVIKTTPPSIQNKLPESEDEEDHIDWASSEDEEIVKQEVEHFERNQVGKLQTTY